MKQNIKIKENNSSHKYHKAWLMKGSYEKCVDCIQTRHLITLEIIGYQHVTSNMNMRKACTQLVDMWEDYATAVYYNDMITDKARTKLWDMMVYYLQCELVACGLSIGEASEYMPDSII